MGKFDWPFGIDARQLQLSLPIRQGAWIHVDRKMDVGTTTRAMAQTEDRVDSPRAYVEQS